MRSIIYYSRSLLEAQDGEDNPRLNMEDFKKQARRATDSGSGSMLLREADQWRGEIEVAENRYPDRVFLLAGGGDDSLFSKLRKAYEEVGVEVQEGNPDEAFRSETSEADEGEDDLAGLKAEATALGIPFNSSSNSDDLKAKVDETRVEQAAKASLLAGQGRALEVNETVNRNNARVGAGDANARAGNLDPANMATKSEDGVTLKAADGTEAREVGNQEQPGEDDLPDDLDELKGVADDEGVEYASNIGADTLRARILESRNAE